MRIRDVIIVGGGPAGLAAAIAAKKAGLDHLVLEKGALVNSLLHYPTQHGVLHDAGAARDRRAAVRQPVREADAAGGAALLPARDRHVRARHRVRRAGVRSRRASRSAADLCSRSTRDRRGGVRRGLHARAVVIATGAYDVPNRLGFRARTCRTSRTTTPSRTRTTASPSSSSAARTRRPKPRSISSGTARRVTLVHRRATLGDVDQVLGEARHREPHQGRLDRGRASTRLSSRSGRPPSSSAVRVGPRSFPQMRCSC